MMGLVIHTLNDPMCPPYSCTAIWAAVWFLGACRDGKELILVRHDMKKASRDQISMITLFLVLDSIPLHPPQSLTHASWLMCVFVVDGIVGCMAMVIKSGGKLDLLSMESSLTYWHWCSSQGCELKPCGHWSARYDVRIRLFVVRLDGRRW